MIDEWINSIRIDGAEETLLESAAVVDALLMELFILGGIYIMDYKVL